MELAMFLFISVHEMIECFVNKYNIKFYESLRKHNKIRHLNFHNATNIINIYEI